MDISAKDKRKPFILLSAVVIGMVIQSLIGGSIPWLLTVVEFGVFAVIMAVMLPIEVSDVGHAFKKVGPTALALFINFVFIPLVAWGMGWLILRDYPDFWVGAILYTLTPCIGWYLIFTDLAKGNVAWGVALLPWNVLLQVLLLPVYLYLLVGKVIPVDPWVLTRSVLLFFVGPFVISYGLRKIIIAARGREYFFGPFKAGLGALKLWSLVVVIVCMFASQKALSFSEANTVGLLILFLCGFFVVLFLCAILAGRLFRLAYEDIATLAFTTTARNSEAVIGIAVAAFPGHPLVYLAIILGPIVELPMLLVISRIMVSWQDWIGGRDRGRNLQSKS